MRSPSISIVQIWDPIIHMTNNCRGIENQNQIGWYCFAGEFIVAMELIILSVLYDHEVGFFLLHKVSDFMLSNILLNTHTCK